MPAKYNKDNLLKMNLLWGKSHRGNPRGHTPLLFFNGMGKEPSLALNIKDKSFTVYVGPWSWESLYSEDAYIVAPKELT